MIQINKIELQVWEAFDPTYKSLGFLNIFECNDLRIQCKENKASGYYMMFYDRKIEIGPNGKFDSWPNGFYDLYETQLRKLI